MNNKTIPVTSPLLPPLEEFIPYLEKIWESRFLTNGGDMHHALEEALCEYLGVKHIVLFANATLALITALQALRVTGEVITTPYSFVATSHALLWNGLKPIFVDIDQDSMNLDPSRIEAAITPQTTAILPVHCYGNPCDVEAIQRIADIHHLKVIYDAAHAFAVRDAGGSVLRHGDLSILSFHATKVFNTFEGGAIICSDENTRQRLNHLKNFGFVDEVTVVMPGINGKLNEVGAAFGLLQTQARRPGPGAAQGDRRALSAPAGRRPWHPVPPAWYPDLRQQRLFPDPGGRRFSAFARRAVPAPARQGCAGAALLLPTHQRLPHVPFAALGGARQSSGGAVDFLAGAVPADLSRAGRRRRRVRRRPDRFRRHAAAAGIKLSPSRPITE